MSVMEGSPYRCGKCGKEFLPGKYSEFLRHLESHN